MIKEKMRKMDTVNRVSTVCQMFEFNELDLAAWRYRMAGSPSSFYNITRVYLWSISYSPTYQTQTE